MKRSCPLPSSSSARRVEATRAHSFSEFSSSSFKFKSDDIRFGIWNSKDVIWSSKDLWCEYFPSTGGKAYFRLVRRHKSPAEVRSLKKNFANVPRFRICFLELRFLFALFRSCSFHFAYCPFVTFSNLSRQGPAGSYKKMRAQKLGVRARKQKKWVCGQKLIARKAKRTKKRPSKS